MVTKRMTIINKVSMFPEYDPPRGIGSPENVEDGLHWRRKLAKYKTGHHDPNWVYMYYVDETGRPFACVIYDRYPKAFVHLLVLPMTIDVDQPDHFERRHICDLKRIHQLARNIANDLQVKYDLPGFLIGYHAIPSMADLHLHIVSADLISPYLKRKEHFHSFTNRDYFLTPEKVEQNLEKYGMVQMLNRVTLKNSLKGRMHCHMCGKTFDKFSILKNHLNEHVIDPDTDSTASV
jgi:diadenosine tetraphosphate (Ap4A) HIT family hydrolase